MIIQVHNNLQENTPKTYLSSTAAAGTTVYAVRNTGGFTSQYAIQIGEVGEEFSEVLIGTVTNVGTITGPASNFEHPADTPIYNIKFNQVVFQKSTTGTAGSATSITDGTVTYQADSLFTQFDDPAAVSADAFRTRFRNSALGSQTGQSDWQVPTGFTFYALAKLRERIKEKLWNGDYLTNSMVDNWVNEWKDEMVMAAVSTNEDYSMGTVDMGFGTAGLGTVTTADFSQIRRFEVTYNGSDFYLSTKQQIKDPLPNQTFISTHPYHNWEGDTVFRVRPPESGGTARISFYRFGTTMVNDTDELPLPLRPYTKSFVDYGLAQAFFKDGKSSDFDRMMIVADAAKRTFINQLSPRDKSGPTMIDVVETIGADDDFWP